MLFWFHCMNSDIIECKIINTRNRGSIWESTREHKNRNKNQRFSTTQMQTFRFVYDTSVFSCACKWWHGMAQKEWFSSVQGHGFPPSFIAVKSFQRRNQVDFPDGKKEVRSLECFIALTWFNSFSHKFQPLCSFYRVLNFALMIKQQHRSLLLWTVISLVHTSWFCVRI